ncbi:MAG: RodZ domain-containing protein [bacterium]
MASELLTIFANELAAKRKKEGLSLQQIHQKTRIEIKFLESIEKANFDIMPELYMRAFIKEYSETIGLKADDTMKKYDLAKSGKTQEDIVSQPVEQEQIKPKPAIQFDALHAEPKEVASKVVMNKNFVYAISSGVIIILSVFVYMVFFNNSSREIVKETPYDEILQENKERFEVKKEETPTIQKLSSDSLYLKIITTTKIWIKVKIDDSTQTDFMSEPNITRIYAATNKFYVVLGNAAGAQLFLNEVPLKFDAVSGSVRTLEIDKDGVKSVKPISSPKTVPPNATGN